MLSLSDLFVVALSMKANAIAPHAICKRLLELGHANGFPVIDEIRAEQGFGLIFRGAGRIEYDGTDWHCYKA